MTFSIMRTPEQARAALELQGISISEFAKQNGFATGAVYRVLAGKVRGRIGLGHKIMVALDMKPAHPSEADIVLFASRKKAA
jgi:gp16 family phage-associated protein